MGKDISADESKSKHASEPEVIPRGNGDRAVPAPTPEPVEAHRGRRRRWPVLANKVGHFLAAFFLLVLSIELMKGGAEAIAPRLQGTFPVDNMVSTMGLGWLGAYLVLSGSPVAAASLALFTAGATTQAQTFTMLSGSRLGASFIVLLVGFLYAMRQRNRHRRRESIGMGVLALGMTAVVYVPGMFLGYGILKSGLLSGVSWRSSAGINGIVDAVWGPITRFLSELLPGPLLFPLGLAVILASFKLLDFVLPALDGEKHAGERGHWMKHPWAMFGLGMLAALLTLSVSVALTILVPLASKGYIERREAIPYIAGANITTLADTLFAAMLLGNPIAVQIVLAQAIAVAIVTLLLLAFLYRPLQTTIMALDEWIVRTTPRLVAFVAILFVMPIGLLFSGRML
ncbi:MAG TPA: hypothetical protein VF097_08375 [Actinomycetota bacterium]